jgi:hypothetical protein
MWQSNYIKRLSALVELMGRAVSVADLATCAENLLCGLFPVPCMFCSMHEGCFEMLGLEKMKYMLDP